MRDGLMICVQKIVIGTISGRIFFISEQKIRLCVHKYKDKAK